MSKRLITVRSGNEEIQMEITEEEYQRYYRPWWQQKKSEQRNREAMKEHGYTEESYDGWKDGILDEQVSVSDFAKTHSQKRTTVSSRKIIVLGKFRDFFRDRGFEI